MYIFLENKQGNMFKKWKNVAGILCKGDWSLEKYLLNVIWCKIFWEKHDKNKKRIWYYILKIILMLKLH